MCLQISPGEGSGGRGQGQGSPPEVSVMNAYEHVPLLPPENFLFVLSFSLSVLCCAVSALTASPSHAPPPHPHPIPLQTPPTPAASRLATCLVCAYCEEFKESSSCLIHAAATARCKTGASLSGSAPPPPPPDLPHCTAGSTANRGNNRRRPL